MPDVANRQQLIDYCLRRLGAPVIEINVDEDQIEDRIDDALQFYFQYHFDGVEKVFIPHTISQLDIDNEYLPISDDINSVINILAPSGFSGGFFNEEFQFRLNDAQTFTGSGSLIPFFQTMSHLNLVQDIIQADKTFHYNRKQDKLFIEADWADAFAVGETIVVEVWRTLDPDTYTQTYNDMFLKKYATALIKQQWGANLKKFGEIQLPGGVVLNGQAIFEEASQEIEQLQEQMSSAWELPVDPEIG